MTKLHLTSLSKYETHSDAASESSYDAEASGWQEDNDYIVGGYRKPSSSNMECLFSLSKLHNETLNAYTHLLPALIFSFLPAYFYLKHFRSTTNAECIDLIMISMYCLGVIACFCFSATYHILSNMDRAVVEYWQALDHCGVVILMWSACIPTIGYTFLREAWLRNVYWVATTGFATLCVRYIYGRRVHSSKTQLRRTLVYSSYGLGTVAICLHSGKVSKGRTELTSAQLPYIVFTAALDLIGAAIYIARIPERWAPGKFDLIGSSHQILHIAVACAAWVHYCGLVEIFWLTRSCKLGLPPG